MNNLKNFKLLKVFDQKITNYILSFTNEEKVVKPLKTLIYLDLIAIIILYIAYYASLYYPAPILFYIIFLNSNPWYYLIGLPVTTIKIISPWLVNFFLCKLLLILFMIKAYYKKQGATHRLIKICLLGIDIELPLVFCGWLDLFGPLTVISRETAEASPALNEARKEAMKHPGKIVRSGDIMTICQRHVKTATEMLKAMARTGSLQIEGIDLEKGLDSFVYRNMLQSRVDKVGGQLLTPEGDGLCGHITDNSKNKL